MSLNDGWKGLSRCLGDGGGLPSPVSAQDWWTQLPISRRILSITAPKAGLRLTSPSGESAKNGDFRILPQTV